MLPPFALAYAALLWVMWAGTRWLGGSDLAVGINLGLLLGLLPFFGLTFLNGRGLANSSMGVDAEQWTAGELRRLPKPTWSVFHHVPLGHRGDLDHVVIGPGRVYAVETKWTSRSDFDRFLAGAAQQAERQAQKLQAVLNGQRLQREVLPVLVVWGPGITDRLGATPQLRGNARVVAGAHAADWLDRMQKAAVGEVDQAAVDAIEQVVRAQDAMASRGVRRRQEQPVRSPRRA